MGATFSRIKNWNAENLTNEDLNAEIDNILDNLTPGGVDDYSTNATQMRIQTDPGEQGTESLATSLAGEIERIRFILKEITGKTYWYESPGTNLNINTDSLVIYQTFDCLNGEADGTAGPFLEYIKRGGLVNASSYDAQDVSASDFGTSNSKFGSYSLTLGAGVIPAVGDRYQNRHKGGLGIHFRNYGASAYLAHNYLMGIGLYLDASGNLKVDLTEHTTASETTKNVNTVTGSSSRTGNSSFAFATLNWAANGVNGAGTDQLSLKYNATTEGTALTSQTFDTNPGNNGFWFIGANPQDPTWDKVSMMKVLPSVEASDAWSVTGSGTPTIDEDGILKIVTSSNTLYYSKTNHIDQDSATVEFKAKFVGFNEASRMTVFSYESIQGSIGADLRLEIMNGAIYLVNNADNSESAKIPINVEEWNVFRITSTTTKLDLFINGICAVSLDFTGGAAAGDAIKFGVVTGATGTAWFEYFKYTNNSATPPYTGNTLGNINDFSVSNDVLDDTIISQLNTSRAGTALKKELFRGTSNPYPLLASGASSANLTNSTAEIGNPVYYLSDGITPVNLLASLDVALLADEIVDLFVSHNGVIQTLSTLGTINAAVQVSGAETASGENTYTAIMVLPTKVGLNYFNIAGDATGSATSSVNMFTSRYLLLKGTVNE